MEQDGLPFRKMHGLGNDFVVIDTRAHVFDPTPDAVRAIANRRTGVGCDQFITIEPPRSGAGVAFMGIRNADGGTVEACGNASRCVGALLLAETGGESVIIETLAGPITARAGGAEGQVTVDMGPARTTWADIPLSAEADTLRLDLTAGPLDGPCAVSMGNPHAVFFVPDAEAVDLTTLGPQIEHHPLFPARTNVEVVHRQPDGSLRMRVWERGVGITQACGTGACATLVAACRRGVTGRRAIVMLDGGPLDITWTDDNRVLMTGAATLAYTGILPPVPRSTGAAA